MDEKLLTVDDLASYLQVSTKTVYRMLRRSQLPSIRVKGLWRFRKQTIDEWLAQREQKVVGGEE